MSKSRILLPTVLLLTCMVILSGRLQAQNATAPAARQKGNATNRTEGTRADRAAEQKGNVPVRIVHENTDQVGRRLVFHMRERFSESGIFRLSDGEEVKLILQVKTRNEFPDRPGMSSIYSVTWTFSYGGDVLSNYLESRTGIAISNRLGETAEEFVAQTYEIYSRYSYLFQEE